MFSSSTGRYRSLYVSSPWLLSWWMVGSYHIDIHHIYKRPSKKSRDFIFISHAMIIILYTITPNWYQRLLCLGKSTKRTQQWTCTCKFNKSKFYISWTVTLNRYKRPNTAYVRTDRVFFWRNFCLTVFDIELKVFG